jgi:hypothetical protein
MRNKISAFRIFYLLSQHKGNDWHVTLDTNLDSKIAPASGGYPGAKEEATKATKLYE